MNEYHGWIVLTKEPGYRDRIHVEWMHDGERRSKSMTSAAEAVDFFDNRSGRPVKLEETPLGVFRVYTEHDDSLIVVSRTKSQNIRANALRTECQRLVGTIRGTEPSQMAGRTEEVYGLCDVAEQLAELTK